MRHESLPTELKGHRNLRRCNYTMTHGSAVNRCELRRKSGSNYFARAFADPPDDAARTNGSSFRLRSDLPPR